MGQFATLSAFNCHVEILLNGQHMDNMFLLDHDVNDYEENEDAARVDEVTDHLITHMAA